MKIGYKLFRLRKDGTLGSLFINRKMIIPVNKWLIAKCYPTKGFKVRPGFHICPKPCAPHLKLNLKSGEKRIWKKVEMIDYIEEIRPVSQGGLWYLANKIRVIN